MAGKYVLKKTTDGQFLFNLKAGNGETILTSERYRQKQGAVNGIQSCKTNSGTSKNYEKRSGASGRYHFVLKATNYEIIGTSEQYSSEAARDNGIVSCMTNGPSAVTDDQA
jgi:uncharacterized protein YegP (UPF0339 family)